MKLLHCTLFLVFSFKVLGNVTPWTGSEGSLSISASYAYQTYDRLWQGNQRTDLQTSIDQNIIGLGLEYVINDKLTFDANFGYGETSFNDIEDSGLTDTQFGLKYQLVNEFFADQEWMPSVSIRIGGIVKGTYESGFIYSLGDGGNGVHASLILGKLVTESSGVYGNIGTRIRNNGIPNEILAYVGYFWIPAERLTLNTGLKIESALSGSDIGDEGFRFPETEERNLNIDASISYQLNQRLSVSFFGSYTVDGKNSAFKPVIGGGLSGSF